MGKRKDTIVSGQLIDIDQDTSTEADFKDTQKPATKSEKPRAEAKTKKIVKSVGKKYAAAKAQIDSNKVYPIEEAVALVKKISFENFDASVEIHIHLNIDPKKQERRIRTSITLPHPIAKEVKILVLAEGNVAKSIPKSKNVEIGNANALKQILEGSTTWDAIVATPKFMPKLATMGKILGPKGLMPNPKNGTLTEDPAKTVKELQAGKTEIRMENNTSLIHALIGKVSFSAEDIIENYQEVMKVLKLRSAKTITVTSTMGPGIKVKTVL